MSWWLPQRMAGWADREALAGDDGSVRYADLLAGASRWRGVLESAGARPGQVVAFDGDYSERTVTLLLALVEHRCVAVPLASAAAAAKGKFTALAGAELFIDCRAVAAATVTTLEAGPRHPLTASLVAEGRPGLILFSSGSTGQPKAMLHDFSRLLEKFEAPRPCGRILTFLLLDHIGGINTLFSGLANGGTIVYVRDRAPEAVCRAVARHRVEVLPTSPTFLNLLLLSGDHRRHDLSSLRLVTYGTEVMPASTLARLCQELPGVRLQQTYGLSELGILRSKSRENGSLWVKVGGEGFETKVVDGVLWVRARSSMLGYLNAVAPVDPDGWFNTHDAVEQDGEWLRFLGRTTEIINVGGQKVYPAEVESAVLEMDNVADVVVRGEANAIVGQCVVARVRLRQPEPAASFRARLRRHCQGRLAPHMVPAKVEVTEDDVCSARGKKLRRSEAASPN
jgi:acyl-coenzyme A synthetase/AMP-(fatty) acid ligase